MMDWLRTILFLPPAASELAESIDAFHFVIIGTTFVGAFAILGVAAYFVVRYRRRSDSESTPEVRIPARYEVPLAGALLSLFLVWWYVGYEQYIEIQSPPEDAVEVYVTGKQWMWKFAYPGGKKSAGYLVVPEEQPVKLIITSRDVIHSFYLPAFRIKRDALPGRYTTTWFEATQEGRYQVLCAEYCGQSHSRMWADLVVLSSDDYADWLEGKTPELVAEAKANATTYGRYGQGASTDLVTQGRQLAATYGCLGCHTTDGQSHIGPTWEGLYGSDVALQNGDVIEVDEDYLTESMMDPEAKRVAGYEAVMPTYRGLLDSGQVGALVAFIKSLEPDHETLPVDLPDVEPLEEGVREDLDGGAPEAEAPTGPDAGGEAGGAP